MASKKLLWCAAKFISEALSALQKIINLTSRQNGNDIVKLARWLRCLFNLTLTYNEEISIKCLEQAIQIAVKKQGVRLNSSNSSRLNSKHAQHTYRASIPSTLITTPPPSSPERREDDVEPADVDIKHKDPYPATELEWLATSSFNHAIDHYVGDNDAKCKEWAEKAMTLAQSLEDNGQLRDLLMGKYSALQLNK